jgi:hypothetical protein
MTWYMTIELCHVSVLHIGVRDLGGVKWSCGHYTGPAFGRVSISLTLRWHLTLVVTSHGSPRVAGGLRLVTLPLAYK